MPSTRKQKAEERRSRQMDLMSVVENVDIVLGSYSRDENGNDGSENEVNLDSGSSRPRTKFKSKWGRFQVITLHQ